MAGPYGLFAKHEEWHDFNKKEPKSAEFRDECKYEDLDQRCYEHCTDRLLAL